MWTVRRPRHRPAVCSSTTSPAPRRRVHVQPECLCKKGDQNYIHCSKTHYKSTYRAPRCPESIPTRRQPVWWCPAKRITCRPADRCPSECYPDALASIGTRPTERKSTRPQCRDCVTTAGQRIAERTILMNDKCAQNIYTISVLVI